MCLSAGCLLLSAPMGGQALQVYSATGANITGSLGGTAFSNSSWELTATADEALATFNSFPGPGMGQFNLWSLPVSPTVRITSMGTVLEAALLPGSSYNWLALSGTFPIGPTPKIGFVYTNAAFNPETAAGVVNVPGSYVNLQLPVNFTGLSLFETTALLGPFPSSAGPLTITSSRPAQGTFRIDPVPTPGPALAIWGVFSWSRKLRRRITRQAD
ncbi:MAG: hypothetical protein VKK99_03250 [Cyanobacteriota bacterium]|nr:hypothetical protein [Cyanobacteriota bacterium]